MSAPDLSSKSAYDYELPGDLIAQNPAHARDQSRLMLLRRHTGAIEHLLFHDLPELLNAGDLLVLNDTRVFHARVFAFLKDARRERALRVELLFLRERSEGLWEGLVRPGKKVPVGTELLAPGGVVFRVGAALGEGLREIFVCGFASRAAFFSYLETHGAVPLPPYITQSAAAPERYQTVYADRAKTGSAAAPTAGLHFTEELFERLARKGVERAFVTLDVGLGTFRPVQTERLDDHVMHSESCTLPPETARRIERTRERGGRVVAVGTTSVRTLESFYSLGSPELPGGTITSGRRETNLFIRPGYEFRCVDALVTNFHLPESTLLMLVCAFGSYRAVMDAYRTAVAEKYRFFSFGDAMILL